MDLRTYIENNHKSAITNPWVGGYRGGDNIKLKLETARPNLSSFCKILSDNNLNYRIIFGTLLGLYREGDLIPHDEDMDTCIKNSDGPKLVTIIPELIKAGFEVVRYDHSVISFGKDHDYIDVYLFKNLKCGCYSLSEKDFTCNNTISYRGEELPTIADPEAFFRRYYGADWKTPIEGLNANPKNEKRV